MSYTGRANIQKLSVCYVLDYASLNTGLANYLFWLNGFLCSHKDVFKSSRGGLVGRATAS